MALDDTLFQSCLKNPNLPFLKSSQSETILLLVFAATANPWLRQWEVLGEVTGLQQSPTRQLTLGMTLNTFLMALGSLYLQHRDSLRNFKGPPIAGNI